MKEGLKVDKLTEQLRSILRGCQVCGFTSKTGDLDKFTHCGEQMVMVEPAFGMGMRDSIWTQGLYEYNIEPGKVYHFSGPGAFHRWEKELKKHNKVVLDAKLPHRGTSLQRRQAYERMESERRSKMKGDWKLTQVEA